MPSVTSKIIMRRSTKADFGSVSYFSTHLLTALLISFPLYLITSACMNKEIGYNQNIKDQHQCYNQQISTPNFHLKQWLTYEILKLQVKECNFRLCSIDQSATSVTHRKLKFIFFVIIYALFLFRCIFYKSKLSIDSPLPTCIQQHNNILFS